jgi:hypothetical protein
VESFFLGQVETTEKVPVFSVVSTCLFVPSLIGNSNFATLSGVLNWDNTINMSRLIDRGTM